MAERVESGVLDALHFSEQVRALAGGKRTESAVYVHVSAEGLLPLELHRIVLACRQKMRIGDEYNVVKLSRGEFRLSFLSYPDFFECPHPALAYSISVDLATGRVRRFSYESSTNRPILHRKEEMLSKDHPRHAEFETLTRSEVACGLFEMSALIGMQGAWAQVLKEKGLGYRGHRLVCCHSGIKSEEPMCLPAIKRHRTAISRQSLSKPVQLLVEHGLLKPGASFFDYGCGQGDDLRILAHMGVKGTGWDPAYRSDMPRTEADCVNLGFVLNVIEDQIERLRTLQDAFALARRILAVSALTSEARNEVGGTTYSDGVLTSRETFQKRFSQDELRQYIEDALETEAVAVGMGIFYVFRSPSERQEFLARRTRRPINWEALSRRLYPRRFGGNAKLKYIENRELLDAFWARMLDLGRVPRKKEYPRLVDVTHRIGSAEKARQLFIELYGERTLQAAYTARKDDWLVFLALANLRKRAPFCHFSLPQQNDIKTFFGNYAYALGQGEQLLRMIADPDIIEEQCGEACVGWQDDQALYLHRGSLGVLDPVLRVYYGCAEILCGETSTVDVVKLHKRSSKVTLLEYDDFEGKMLPELQWRTKINLRTQRIDVFDHRSSERAQVLYFKERFVRVDHPQRKKWASYSDKLRRLGFSEAMGFGPTRQELSEFLAAHGLTLGLRRCKNKSTPPPA
ncbi:MAG: DNA phosphorothioation-associated putative methyltransferase [Kiritimatiellae bacterium]|nr:DNA phosphorothioation-associated putative methyltransferase [Kiritimatiellia bacterium]